MSASKQPSTELFDRLMQISWQAEPEPRAMVRLMKDYLRIAARWATALGCTEAWPFFDIAEKIQPNLRAPDNELRDVEQRLRTLHVPDRILRTCLWALHWDRIKDLSDVKEYALPDPYVPLIEMYEQGGRFSTEHGYVDVEGAGFRLGCLADYLPRESRS